MIQHINKISRNIIKTSQYKAENQITFPIASERKNWNYFNKSHHYFSSISLFRSNLAPPIPLELMRFLNYSFRKLTIEHFDQALQLLTHQFATQEPLTNAYFRKFSIQENIKTESWRQLWKKWLINACTNNLSVAIIDENSNGALIGVFVAKDFHYEPQNFQSQFMTFKTFIKPGFKLQKEMIKQIDVHIQQELLKLNHVMDMWGVAIDKKHMGQKLLGKMVLINEKLALQQNYKYSFCFATNFKTQKSLHNLGYQLIAKTDATKYETNGEYPFSEIDEEQRFPSLWLKPLILN